MKKDCILIATLPSLSNMERVRHVFEHPLVSEVRYNTGVQSPYSVDQTLDMLQVLSLRYQKRLWIDIKGRQLRVAKWADPLYSCIELNHKVQLTYPAHIYFRNGDRVNVTHVKDGNRLFVDPLPREALGAGQSVNVIAESVTVEGYLTALDEEYLRACRTRGLCHVMASFAESQDDTEAIRQLLPNAHVVSKIESLRGVSWIKEQDVTDLMAARDDLFLQTGQDHRVLDHLQAIIERDSGAICASGIFSSLERRESPNLADLADIELMYRMGYRKFMLCDNVCNHCFDRAMKAWESFVNG